MAKRLRAYLTRNYDLMLSVQNPSMLPITNFEFFWMFINTNSVSLTLAFFSATVFKFRIANNDKLRHIYVY